MMFFYCCILPFGLASASFVVPPIKDPSAPSDSESGSKTQYEFSSSKKKKRMQTNDDLAIDEVKNEARRRPKKFEKPKSILRRELETDWKVENTILKQRDVAQNCRAEAETEFLDLLPEANGAKADCQAELTDYYCRLRNLAAQTPRCAKMNDKTQKLDYFQCLPDIDVLGILPSEKKNQLLSKRSGKPLRIVYFVSVHQNFHAVQNFRKLLLNTNHILLVHIDGKVGFDKKKTAIAKKFDAVLGSTDVEIPEFNIQGVNNSQHRNGYGELSEIISTHATGSPTYSTDSVIILPRRLPIIKGGSSLLSAKLYGLHYAQKELGDFDFWIPLSETDGVLQNPDQFLNAFRGYNFVGLDPCHSSFCVRPLGRSCESHGTFTFYKSLGMHLPILLNQKSTRGPEWVVLETSLVKKISNGVDEFLTSETQNRVDNSQPGVTLNIADTVNEILMHRKALYATKHDHQQQAGAAPGVTKSTKKRKIAEQKRRLNSLHVKVMAFLITDAFLQYQSDEAFFAQVVRHFSSHNHINKILHLVAPLPPKSVKKNHGEIDEIGTQSVHTIEDLVGNRIEAVSDWAAQKMGLIEPLDLEHSPGHVIGSKTTQQSLDPSQADLDCFFVRKVKRKVSQGSYILGHGRVVPHYFETMKLQDAKIERSRNGYTLGDMSLQPRFDGPMLSLWSPALLLIEDSGKSTTATCGTSATLLSEKPVDIRRTTNSNLLQIRIGHQWESTMFMGPVSVIYTGHPASLVLYFASIFQTKQKPVDVLIFREDTDFETVILKNEMSEFRSTRVAHIAEMPSLVFWESGQYRIEVKNHGTRHFHVLHGWSRTRHLHVLHGRSSKSEAATSLSDGWSINESEFFGDSGTKSSDTNSSAAEYEEHVRSILAKYYDSSS